MEQNKELKLIKDDGTEITCEILFTYFSEEYNKNYVVFEVPGEEMLSAASYDVNEDGTSGDLVFISDDAEWKMLEEVVADYFENQEDDEDDEEHECCCGKGHCHDDKECDCDEECDCDGECECHSSEKECK